MTTLATPTYWPTRDLPTNGHQPIILPVWTSRQAVDEKPPAEATVDASTDRPTGAATLKAVAPLVVVNGLAVYGQLAYALEHIAPTDWVVGARVALAVGFAAAVESVALYVGWHAHDALLLKSHATARSLRRWSFLIAAAVATMNYAHFAAPGLRPTAAACAFGLLSLLSPWMWGLHTRRAARLQLLKERKVDEAGAEFSSERRRAFPVRTWQARRWSIDHGVTDPREAWLGYNADRRNRLTDRLAVVPTTRLATDRAVASTADRLPTDRPTATPTVQSPPDATDRPTANPTGHPARSRRERRLAGRSQRRFARRPVPTDRPTAGATEKPTAQSAPEATKEQPKPRPRPTGKHSSSAISNAAILREKYGDRLTKSASAMRTELGWSYDRMVAAVAAHKAKADRLTGATS